jgi:hypothetical protein
MPNDGVACPVCRSGQVSSDFHRQEVRDLFDIPSQELTLALCEGCGFLFQHPLLPALEGTAHYEQHSSYVTLPSAQIETAKRDQFGWISKVAKSSGFAHLLRANETPFGLYEIGASVGALLTVANAAGWTVGGVEPSAAATQVARDRYGLAIATGDLRTVSKIELPIITMIHVLEHIPDPVSALAHLFAIAPSTCMLAIEVPDFSLPKNAGGSGYFVPEHVSYFTADTLVRAATAAGWSTVDVHVHEYPREASEFCMYPVLRGTFQKLSGAALRQTRELARDVVANYLDTQARELRDKVREFARAHASLVLFGGGWHTQMLLGVLGPEERAKINIIVDSNPARSGGEIEGIKIDSATNLAKYEGCGFVVSSQGYQEQIVDQIRATLADAAILTFY